MGLRDLPDGSGERHARAFCRLGWERKPKEGKGSHIIVAKAGLRLSIPAHPSVKRTVLAKLLKQAGVTVDDYIRAYKGRQRP